VQLAGRGHDAIRATHTKTIEITADESITERATCVIAVAAHPIPPAPLAGPVRVTITAGDEAFGLDAVANPSWDPRGPAVLRRSPLRLPGTLATHASAAAADLPRALVAALRDPHVRVEVRVDRAAAQPCIVLFAADPALAEDPRLAAELDAADAVVAEDAGARRLLHGSTRGRSAPRGRLLAVATTDLPGASVSLGGAAVETVGLPARLAVAAACPSRAPLVLGPDDADPRALLRSTPSTHRLVLTVERARLADLLALAARERGTGLATVAQEYLSPVPAAPDALPVLPSNDVVYCCLHPAAGSDALDPAVRAAIIALLTDDVATKTAAHALAALTGWQRRRAYDAVLALAAALRSDHAAGGSPGHRPPA